MDNNGTSREKLQEVFIIELNNVNYYFLNFSFLLFKLC